MERAADVSFLSFFRISRLADFPYGVDVAVHYGVVEVDAFAVVPLHELQAPLIEVAESPVPNMGVGYRVHCQPG